jgi:hypothetical protein
MLLAIPATGEFDTQRKGLFEVKWLLVEKWLRWLRARVVSGNAREEVKVVDSKARARDWYRCESRGWLFVHDARCGACSYSLWAPDHSLH